MAGSGGDAPPPLDANGGEYLLSLLRNPHAQPPQAQPQLQQQHLQQQQSPLLARATPVSISQPQQQQHLALDPAVAAVGPSLPFPPLWQTNGRDLSAAWPQSVSPPFHPNFPGFPQNTWPSQFPGNQGISADDLRRLGFSGIQNLIHQKQQDQKLVFGSLGGDIQNLERLPKGNLLDNSKFNVSRESEAAIGNRNYNSSDMHRAVNLPISNSNSSAYAVQERNSEERRGGSWVNHNHSGNYRAAHSPETRRPPPGFSGKPRGGGGSWDYENRRRNFDRFVNDSQSSSSSNSLNEENGKFRSAGEMGLSGQLDHPGPPVGSSLHSVSASDIEESLVTLHGDGHGDKISRNGRFRKDDDADVDDLGEHLVDSLLLEDESDDKNEKKQRREKKESRIDSRGQQLLSQRMRSLKWRMECRGDIDRFNAPFRAIYESLTPPEEEKAKQKQLLALLERLVCKEWPDARLYLYGSCANSFGVSKSDIDVCLAIDDADINKSELLLKLADILESDNLQNVQALTRARVPIVKLMDPVTGISCDICINNILAVVNTKLLRDYAQIDARLRQLAFIVKHWAKSRGVNATYQGTLSSYAYVLMCIHFLQQRRPSILPCLQGMEATYSVTVDGVRCAYFDQVERLRHFGSHNRDNIAHLVWAFFNYWAHGHDYANSVISVRTGSIISKHEKDWTRRIGNDRHLICIEDPFETSHDLGRVVDKYSIRVLREEFERAADIMQCDPSPCVTLFEPYIPG